jgi:hypothetical protein
MGRRVPMKKPDSFCWHCGEPYPWATRIIKLFDRIDHEDLDEPTLLTIREQIAVLSAPVDEATDDERVAAGHRMRDLAPEAWKVAVPVLQSLLTAEVKRRLGLPYQGLHCEGEKVPDAQQTTWGP